MNLIKRDPQGEDIEIVKEQILDINDKFDFLVSLLMKSHKIQTKTIEDDEGEEDVDFAINEGENLTQEGYDPIEYSKILEFVHKFEELAKKASGDDRKVLRKPQPARPLTQRVKAAVKYYQKHPLSQQEKPTTSIQ